MQKYSTEYLEAKKLKEKERQHRVLVEYTRLLKIGSTFYGKEESVFAFLNLTK